MSRTYAYCRASTNMQSASPDTQRRLAEEYCRKVGRALDGVYIDPAVSGKKSIFEREAGKELMLALRRGDHLVVAHLDRLSRSFLNFATIIDQLMKKGVTLHACDMPGGVIDPDNPISRMIVQIMGVFAEFERSLIAARTRDGQADRRAQGKRFTRHAPYGWRWQKAGYNRKTRRDMFIMVPNERERVIMRKAAEQRLKGYSYDQIRQYFNYEWKVRTRSGGHWTLERIRALTILSLRMAAEEHDAVPDLPTADDLEEEFFEEALVEIDAEDTNEQAE